jgi:hypothetical protein
MNVSEGVEYNSTDSNEHSKRVLGIHDPYFVGLDLSHIQATVYRHLFCGFM